MKKNFKYCFIYWSYFYLQMKHLNKDQEKSFLKLWNFNNAESLFYIISDIETVVYESAHFQYKNLSDRYSNNM